MCVCVCVCVCERQRERERVLTMFILAGMGLTLEGMKVPKVIIHGPPGVVSFANYFFRNF